MRKTVGEPSQWMMAAVRPLGQKVVIVGAGVVGRRRAMLLAGHGADVRLYDPHVELSADDLPGNVRFYKRRVGKRDLLNAWLVVVATNDDDTNRTVGEWVEEFGLECNRADDVDEGSFAVPAMVSKEQGWQMAILGGEAGPLFSTWMKGLIEQVISLPKVAQVYDALAGARSELRYFPLGAEDRAEIMRIVMSAALEADDEVDGAELARVLAGKKTG